METCASSICRDAIDEKTVLDIGSRKALGRLELGERALVKLLLAGTDLRVGLREFAFGLFVQLMHLIGSSLLTLELCGELVELCGRIAVIGFVGLEAGKHVDAARLRTMHRLAQLGKARHHVAALLLEQEHARVETVEGRLAATTLLGYVACEQTPSPQADAGISRARGSSRRRRKRASSTSESASFSRRSVSRQLSWSLRRSSTASESSTDLSSSESCSC